VVVDVHLCFGSFILACESRQSPRDVSPGLLPLDHPANRLDDIRLASADLLRRVPVSERESAVLDALEVNCDTEGDSKLVVAGVPLADADTGLVDLVRDVLCVERGLETLDQWAESCVSLQRDEEDFDGGYCWGE